MAVRQYIGARYTIKVYENESNNAEWTSNTAYERLTLVTYQNSTYLSKADVTASTGNPADNPEFWVETGFYNGQIAAILAQISSINDNIGNLTSLHTPVTSDLVNSINSVYDTSLAANKKFWYIGDSFLGGTGWGAYIDQALGKTDSLVSYENGIGFQNVGNLTGKNISEMVADVTPDPDVTDVIIVAGCNDCQSTYVNTIRDYVEAAIDAVRAKLPNAHIWVGFNGTYLKYSETYGPRIPYKGDIAFNIAYATQHKLNCAFMRSVGYSIQWSGLCSDAAGVHLNAAGLTFMARAIMNHLFGGGDSCPLQYKVVNHGITYSVLNLDSLYMYTEPGAVIFEDSSNPISLTARVFYTLYASDVNQVLIPSNTYQLAMTVPVTILHSGGAAYEDAIILPRTNQDFSIYVDNNYTGVTKIFVDKPASKTVPVLIREHP